MERNILFFLYGLMIFLYGLYLWAEVDLSATNAEYSILESKSAAIHKQNMELKNQLLQKESYYTINQEARAQGFVTAPIITP